MIPPAGQSCLTCKFWNQCATTLQIDPTGIGNAPIAGKVINTDWGQCRFKAIEPVFTHLGSWG